MNHTKKLVSTKNRHMVLGVPEVHLIAKIESELIKGARKYFEENNYTEVVVPHITKATGSCENIDTLFEVDFFGERSFLCQTGQLYLESLIPYIGNVFCIGPSFRAEPDVDNRHLTEFTLIEIEFPGGFDKLLREIENTIYSMIQSVLKNKKEELEMLNIDIDRLKGIKMPFKKITYTEAVEILAKNGFDVNWGDDLKSRHEAFLSKYFGSVPLFLTHYPVGIKFFNMRGNPENPKVVNSADLILPFSGEAVGSAERHHEYEEIYYRLTHSEMLKKLIDKGGSIKDFQWYLDLIKSGVQVPHSGCGIGLNRVTQFVLGVDDCRMTTVWPQNREGLL